MFPCFLIQLNRGGGDIKKIELPEGGAYFRELLNRAFTVILVTVRQINKKTLFPLKTCCEKL